jgi:hypothetical protein
MKSGSVERLALEPQPTSVTHHISTTTVAMRPRIVRRSPLTAQRIALKLRATRLPANMTLNVRRSSVAELFTGSQSEYLNSTNRFARASHPSQSVDS